MPGLLRRERIQLYGLVLLSVGGYLLMGYALPRQMSGWNLLVFTLLFGGYLAFIATKSVGTKPGVWMAISFRVLLLFSIPTLSDDFYRFLWDGRLLDLGVNPYLQTPDEFLEQGQLTEADLMLYRSLNFTQYHTLYPPIPQFTHWLAASFGGSSMVWQVVLLRIPIILAEIVSILLLVRLLPAVGVEARNALIYGLNPLVILELTGNLHHEAYVVLFLLIAISMLVYRRHLLAAVGVGLAVGSKLLPIIFLPFLGFRIGGRKAILFGAVSLATVAILYVPFMHSEILEGMSQSTSLYFQRFEFNASLYYIVRTVGYWWKGYNIIQTAGPWLGVISGAGRLIFSIFATRGQVTTATGMLGILMIYLSLSTTVHPWYITPLVMLGCLTRFTFPVAWSYLIFLSYMGYTSSGYSEPSILILIEYVLLYGWLVFEIWQKQSPIVALRSRSSGKPL